MLLKSLKVIQLLSSPLQIFKHALKFFGNDFLSLATIEHETLAAASLDANQKSFLANEN